MAFGLGGQAKILLEEQFCAKKKRDTDATLHLWLDGHEPTSNSQTLSRVVVGSWELSVGS
jgi:hypothetical protein